MSVVRRFIIDKDPQWAGTSLEMYDGLDALEEIRFNLQYGKHTFPKSQQRTGHRYR